MAHTCRGCGHVVRDGSRALLDGCPVCGSMKFAYQPPKPVGVRPKACERETPQKAQPPQRKAQAQKRQAASAVRGARGANGDQHPQRLERFESVRLLDDGTYLINLENLLAGEQFVLTLEEGRYLIPLVPRQRR